MAITQRLQGLDSYFRMTTGSKIIANDLNHIDMKHQEMLTASLMTVYDNVDTISTIPSCDCGEVKGRYVVGVTCPRCNTECKELYEKVEPIIWLKTLDDTLRFLNPTYWLLIKELLGGKEDWLRWLCDSSFNPEHEPPPHVMGIHDEILKGMRSYTNTMNNLKPIFYYLLNLPKYKEEEKRDIEAMIVMHDEYLASGDLFSSYLPIVNKQLFVMENTSKGRFVNLVVSDIVDVVLTWIKKSNNFMIDRNMKKAGIATAVAVSELAAFFYNFTDKFILKKAGIFRKHVYGARSHFTFRAVIVAIPGKHNYDDVHIPWCVAVTIFEPHIMNKLERRGISYKKSMELFFRATKCYDSLIHEILLELMAEAPNGKVPIIIHRNRITSGFIQ